MLLATAQLKLVMRMKRPYLFVMTVIWISFSRLISVDSDIIYMHPVAVKKKLHNARHELHDVKGDLTEARRLLSERPEVPDSCRAIIGTSTAELLKSIGSDNCQDYIDYIKDEVQQNIVNWIEAWFDADANVQFFVYPAWSFEVFKDRISVVIYGFFFGELNIAHPIRIPRDANISSLSFARLDVAIGMARLINEWIDDLMPVDDTMYVLYSIPNDMTIPYAPVDGTKLALKDAIMAFMINS